MDTLTNIYVSMLLSEHPQHVESTEFITEQIEKGNRFIRFVLPVTIDFIITQGDFEEVYTYENYKTDVESGVSEKEIIHKLESFIEDLALKRFYQINNDLENVEIKLQKTPNSKNAQFYRFTFEALINDYKDQYNMEQKRLIDTELQSQ